MVDSCSSSAGSSFRELDDVFLQTQTRIWLGEVLGSRLDEDLPISDLLQDGEILFEVAEVLWNLLLTKKELRHLKQKIRPFGSKKIGGRYRPYSNIDSFFKVCKILGLSGIDLFSPSDVVEKKNTRKVCICIRALSKKARSKMLAVPNFNVVRNSISMSTDMVGVLRRSLESPQCTVSSSSGSTLQKGSLKSKQEKIYSGQTHGDDDSSSDESDEAESRYMGENSLSPVGQLDYGYQVNSDQQNFPEAYSHRKSTGNFNYSLEKDNSVFGDSSCASVGESNYISEYLAFSDLMVHANNGDGTIISDGEKNMFDFFLNIDSQESGRRSFQNGPQRKFYDDDDDIEVSSTTSMTSVLGRLLNLELFDEDESLSPNNSIESKENEAETHNGDSFVLSEQPKIDASETQPATVLDSQEAHSKLSPGVLLDSTEPFPPPQHNNPGKGICLENRDAIPHDNQETRLGSDSYIVHQKNQISDIGIYACASNSIQDSNTNAENGSLDSSEHRHIQEDNTLEGKKDTSTPMPLGKRSRRRVLGTVAKGTAIAGVLFLLIQIRKSIGNNGQDGKLRAQVSKNNGQDTKPQAQASKKNKKFLATKPQMGGTGKGVYPTDRIRL